MTTRRGRVNALNMRARVYPVNVWLNLRAALVTEFRSGWQLCLAIRAQRFALLRATFSAELYIRRV